MKQLIIFVLLCLAPCSAAPLDVQFSAFGTWPLCTIDAQFCVPDSAATYFLLVKPSGLDVLAFRYQIRYLRDGKECESAGYFIRQFEYEYTDSGIVVTGKVDSVLSMLVDEVVAQ